MSIEYFTDQYHAKQSRFEELCEKVNDLPIHELLRQCEDECPNAYEGAIEELRSALIDARANR